MATTATMTRTPQLGAVGTNLLGILSSIATGVLTLQNAGDSANFAVGQSLRLSGQAALGYVISVVGNVVTISATAGGAAGTPSSWVSGNLQLFNAAPYGGGPCVVETQESVGVTLIISQAGGDLAKTIIGAGYVNTKGGSGLVSASTLSKLIGQAIPAGTSTTTLSFSERYGFGGNTQPPTPLGAFTSITAGVITLLTGGDALRFTPGQTVRCVFGAVSEAALGYVISASYVAGVGTLTVAAAPGGAAATPTNWSLTSEGPGYLYGIDGLLISVENLNNTYQTIQGSFTPNVSSGGSGTTGSISGGAVIIFQNPADVLNFAVGQKLALVVQGVALAAAGFVIAVGTNSITVSTTSGGSAGIPTNWNSGANIGYLIPFGGNAVVSPPQATPDLWLQLSDTIVLAYGNNNLTVAANGTAAVQVGPVLSSAVAANILAASIANGAGVI